MSSRWAANYEIYWAQSSVDTKRIVRASSVNLAKSVLASDVSILFQDEVQCLVDFLAQPNVVSILDLSSTDIPSEVLFSALVRGCTQHLSHLNLARNPFLTKKSKGEFHKVLKSIE